MLGTVVSWTAPSKTMKTQDLQSAALAAGLDPTLVKPVSYRSAFKRASREISDDLIVRRIADGETEDYQVTLESKHDDEFFYTKHCNIKVNKSTGVVECDNEEIQKQVQARVDFHVEHQNTSDMTRLIQKVFSKNEADLVPLRRQGGVYFVPQSQNELLVKVDAFVAAIGGSLFKYHLSTTSDTAESVATNMSNYLRGLISELKDSCKEIDTDTPDYVLARRFQKFAVLRMKVECHGELLRNMANSVQAEIDAAEQEVMSTMAF